MDVAYLIGRIILGLFFVNGGLNHFRNMKMMTGYAASKGVLAPGAGVAGTGVLLIVGGLSLLLGVYPRVGIVLLIIFLVGVSFKMHNFWSIRDPQAKMSDQVNFMKNMALVGALLMLFAIPKPWPFSLVS